MWYVTNMSLALDLIILLGTVPIVIFGEPLAETNIAHARRDAQLADDIPGRLTFEPPRPGILDRHSGGQALSPPASQRPMLAASAP
jgi:hypothetical protein